jgi:hypothetical protein
VLPARFQFDGASLPRLTWTLLGITPYDPRIITPGAGHDWLCDSACDVPMSFEEANEIFRLDLIAEGISEELAYLMYTAVSLFGRSYWRTETTMISEEA